MGGIIKTLLGGAVVTALSLNKLFKVKQLILYKISISVCILYVCCKMCCVKFLIKNSTK